MELKGYAAIISGAIGVTDKETLDKVEDIMRHIVFHSTLDWQAREELERGAREAYAILRIQRRSTASGVLPEDWETAGLLGVPVTEIPRLRKVVS